MFHPCNVRGPNDDDFHLVGNMLANARRYGKTLKCCTPGGQKDPKQGSSESESRQQWLKLLMLLFKPIEAGVRHLYYAFVPPKGIMV